MGGHVRVVEKYRGIDSRVGVVCEEFFDFEAIGGKYVYFISPNEYLSFNALENLYDLSEVNSLDLILFESDARNIRISRFDVFDYRDIVDDIFKLDTSISTKFFRYEFFRGFAFDDLGDSLIYFYYIFKARRIMCLDERLCHGSGSHVINKRKINIV